MPDQSYGVTEAARNLGIKATLLGRWQRQAAWQTNGSSGRNGPMTAEHDERLPLRKEGKRLRMERESVQKAPLFFTNASRWAPRVC